MLARAWKLVCAYLLAVAPALASEQCDKVKYSSHENYPPFHWYHQGKFYGVSHDISKMLLAKYGITHQVQKPQPWKRVLLSAKQGDTDLVLGLKNVPERREYLSFTDALVLYNPVAVFVRRDKTFDYVNWNSLIGKTGNMNLGDRHGAEFDRFAEQYLDIHRVKGLAANFEMLLSGRADFFITGYYPGMAYLSSNNLASKVTILSPDFIDGYIHFGFVKSSSCVGLLERFNKDLEALINTATYRELVQKNTELWRQQKLITD